MSDGLLMRAIKKMAGNNQANKASIPGNSKDSGPKGETKAEKAKRLKDKKIADEIRARREKRKNKDKAPQL